MSMPSVIVSPMRGALSGSKRPVTSRSPKLQHRMRLGAGRLDQFDRRLSVAMPRLART